MAPHEDAHAVEVIEDFSRHLPLVGAMTARNFREIRELLDAGRTLEPAEVEMSRVVRRGLIKAGPFQAARTASPTPS